MPLKLIYQKKKADRWIAVITIALCLSGLIMIFESSNVSAFADFGDKYHYIKEQLIWFSIGVVMMVITSFISYKKYFLWSVPLLLFTIGTLIAVFIPGIGIHALGARRWVGFGSFNFQPSELTKLTFIFYLSAWFSNKEKGRLLPFLMLLSLMTGLIILQPDLGTAIILTIIALIIYFLSGAPLWHFGALIPCVVIAVLFLALSSPYRFARLTTFLHPNSDPLGASYHIRQIILSLGSGGFFGVGLGGSKQKYQYLPEATTDSIFAIFGEDFGFIGSLVFITIFVVLLYRIYIVVKRAPDKYSYLLSGGIFALISAHVAVNLGAVVALLPLTGVPLPFISYGGSNLVVLLTAVGIILNISKYGVSKKA